MKVVGLGGMPAPSDIRLPATEQSKRFVQTIKQTIKPDCVFTHICKEAKKRLHHYSHHHYSSVKTSLSSRRQSSSNIQDIPSQERRAASELCALPLIAHHSNLIPPEMTSDWEDFFTITSGFQTAQTEKAPRYWLFKSPRKPLNGRFHGGLDENEIR